MAFLYERQVIHILLGNFIYLAFYLSSIIDESQISTDHLEIRFTSPSLQINVLRAVYF